MWSHEPGSFTRIIAAMVSPRKTSSETTRSARDASPTVRVFGTAMASAVAMGSSSAGRIVQQQGKSRNVDPAPGKSICAEIRCCRLNLLHRWAARSTTQQLQPDVSRARHRWLMSYEGRAHESRERQSPDWRFWNCHSIAKLAYLAGRFPRG